MFLYCVFLLTLPMMVRVLCSILAIYLQAVFLVPCADSYGTETSSLADHANESTHAGEHDHSQTADMCSPFCQCNCCGTVLGGVFHWEGISFSELQTIELTSRVPHYVSPFVPRYVGEIWQPPKINV
ncbi:MAG: DUF6660 family protein [Sphingobacterium sp.]